MGESRGAACSGRTFRKGYHLKEDKQRKTKQQHDLTTTSKHTHTHTHTHMKKKTPETKQNHRTKKPTLSEQLHSMTTLSYVNTESCQFWKFSMHRIPLLTAQNLFSSIEAKSTNHNIMQCTLCLENISLTANIATICHIKCFETVLLLTYH